MWLWTGRAICWTDHRWVGTHCLCVWSSWLQSPTMGHKGCPWGALVVQGERLCAWCRWCISGHNWLYLHQCQASILPLLHVPASSSFPSGLCAGQHGYSQGHLGECRCSYPWGGGWPLWTACPECLQSVGISLGLAACDPTNPLVLGSTVCCTLGHVQWNIKWHQAQLWTIGHAGCFGLWVWGGILCERGSDLGSHPNTISSLGLYWMV